MSSEQAHHHNVSTKTLGFAALTSLTWGFTGIFVRLLPPIPPLTVTAGRLVIAFAVVLPLLLGFQSTRYAFRQALGYPASYVLALLLAGYYLLATAAFQMAPVAEVALLLSTPPLFVLAIRGIRGELSSRAEIIGALLAVGGIALILFPKMSFAGNQAMLHVFGNLLAMCAAFLTATYAYLYRVLVERGRVPEASGVSLLTFLLGGLMMSLGAVFVPTPTGLNHLDGHDVLVFLGLGVVSTAVPTLGFALASKHLPAIITATISLFIPLFSGVFAYLILGERLPMVFLAGCVLVLWGVFMIIRKR